MAKAKSTRPVSVAMSSGVPGLTPDIMAKLDPSFKPSVRLKPGSMGTVSPAESSASAAAFVG